MVEFQQNMWHMMQTSIEAAMCIVIHANPQAQARQHHIDQVFAAPDENNEVEDNNPFVGQREQPDQQQRQEMIVAPTADNRKWDMGFKVDLPEFHGGLQPE